MKLIDLLVQELPKRGGWPEGALSVMQSSYDFELYFYNKKEGIMHLDIFLSKRAEDEQDAEITREQYESALAESQQPVWNGVGLPPVGCECEYNFYDRSGDNWRGVKILYSSIYHVIAIYADKSLCEEEFSLKTSPRLFRPIRAEAERRKHDAVVALAVAGGSDGNLIGMKLDDGQIVGNDWFDVYDAISAGKIPGIKLED